MAVTFTTNIGLAKPDDTELAKKWTLIDNLQDANNTIIENATNFPLNAYTPAIIAQTTVPNVGAGKVRGEYQIQAGFVWGSFVIEFLNPGVVAGVGEFAFGLPMAIDQSFHTVDTAFGGLAGVASTIGEGYLYDDSSVANSGHCCVQPLVISGVSYVRLATEGISGKTITWLTAAQPYVPATLDHFAGSFFYKKA